MIQLGKLRTTCQPHVPIFSGPLGSPVHCQMGINGQLKGIRVDYT